MKKEWLSNMKFELTIEEYRTIQAALEEYCHILDQIKEKAIKRESDEDSVIYLSEILKSNRQVIAKLRDQYEAQEEYK